MNRIATWWIVFIVTGIPLLLIAGPAAGLLAALLATVWTLTKKRDQKP